MEAMGKAAFTGRSITANAMHCSGSGDIGLRSSFGTSD
jgi:hypothetical protein